MRKHNERLLINCNSRKMRRSRQACPECLRQSGECPRLKAVALSKAMLKAEQLALLRGALMVLLNGAKRAANLSKA
jgi:hypothetical protein